MKLVYDFKKNEIKDYREDSKNKRGKAKIKIREQLIGKGIKVKKGVEGEYEDSYGNQYKKTTNNGLLIISDLEENGESQHVAIESFNEGDYGLWLEKKAPYYIDGGDIVERGTNKRNSKEEVLNLEENKFLQKEERCSNDFLWIYPGEKIVFPPEEVVEAKEEEIQEEKTQEEETQEKEGESSKNSSQGEEEKPTQAQNETSKGTEKSEAKAEKEEDELADLFSDLSVSKGGGYQPYVCDGAMLRCSKGVAPGTLKILPVHGVYISGKPMATIEDNKGMVNIQPFGVCDRQKYPPPCTPQPAGPWKGGKDSVTIKGKPALLKGGTLKCGFGGTITIINPGQNKVKG